MNDRKFLSFPLDAQLLATPFKVATNWYVLTGAACCGKTTLINMLSVQGFNVIPESARSCFDAEIAKGRTLAEIHQNCLALQDAMIEMQFENEARCSSEAVIFLDRGMPDSITFYRLHGGDPNRILPRCFSHRYAGVFILDRLPFQRNNQLGPEDEESSRFLDEWLERDYRSLSYEVIRVPVMGPQERLAFILNNIRTVPLAGKQ